MNIFIFANCHGQIYKNYINKYINKNINYKLDYAISYESLKDYEKLLPTFKAADILIIQPVSNYKEFTLENLNNVIKKDCLVIRVPFVRFDGFWPKEKAKVLKKIEHAAVTDFPKVNTTKEIADYLTEQVTDSKLIFDIFNLALIKLAEIEKSGDIKFYDFFLKNYKMVPLFRDQLHPTTVFFEHFAAQIIGIISEKRGLEFNAIDQRKPGNAPKEYGHFRPIKNIFAKELGLQYDLNSYFIYNRFEYLSNILAFENDADEMQLVKNINDLKNIVFSRKPKKVIEKNPYENLPEKAFWKLAISNRSMFDIDGIWSPKFNITKTDNIVTFGSCFAQHIGNALKHKGFNWLITERPPECCNPRLSKKYNYNIFSARTANIYTTSLLMQWTEWSLGIKKVPTEIWEKENRFYDPFRPTIEPNGFESKLELINSREVTLKSFKSSIEKASYFVFTLGLTESWFNKNNFEYPMCPGTVSGFFDSAQHVFVNQDYNQISSSLLDAIALMRQINPDLKFIITVSPVPLTATNTDKHVAVATMGSKSILRAVAEKLTQAFDYIDYFPSYEIINSPIFKGVFFEPNQRSVNPFGVNFVMENFFKCLESKFDNSKNRTQVVKSSYKKIEVSEDVVCEEELLANFGDEK
ncbi:GSCFA domain-containing protein [Thalassotalea psychrophila]|uniref:GSCFA domain-containing protein n=1 Tax=Thalassotalea psychrophila TaxID=3065647 RepID=A0ABY9TU67_9GAMM|nr:GSCFA domain-containing protein [Colwelliaceae bacterium SQ149]